MGFEIKHYKAFLFDLNGTMIDDMAYHIKAWQKILYDLGSPITYEETKNQCYGKNYELLERIFPERFTEQEKKSISIEKEKSYQEAFKAHLKLIDGLDIFLDNAKESGIKMAIGSAAIKSNIDFVLDGLHLRKYFDIIVSADDVEKSKPDPETYIKCAKGLDMEAKDCLVFEDSPKGTESARLAGMDSLVITTMHTPEEFNPIKIVGFIQKYNNLLSE